MPTLRESRSELTAAAAQRRKTRAAALSICSNATLIVLKLVGSVVTGSIALLTDAVQSGMDLLASVIAFVAIRKAGQPADESHPYGHEKAENLAAAVEGMLILLGAAVIIYQAAHRLVRPTELESVGFGIVVMAGSLLANLAVSTYLQREARVTESAALEGDAAHLRTDAMVSAGVLGALALVEVTGIQRFDPAMALAVAVAIIITGGRIVSRAARTLLDESLPETELAAVREAVDSHGAQELEGYHKLRARRAGSRRHIDLHAQFRAGTSLERAHELSHELTRAIAERLSHADVLIHLEPQHVTSTPGVGELAGAGLDVPRTSKQASPHVTRPEAQQLRAAGPVAPRRRRAWAIAAACAVLLLTTIGARATTTGAGEHRAVIARTAPMLDDAARAVEASHYTRALAIADSLTDHDELRIRRKISRHLAVRARAAVRHGKLPRAKQLLAEATRYPATAQLRRAHATYETATRRAADGGESVRRPRSGGS